MRITNFQLRLLLPLVLQASKDNPSPDWDSFLESLIQLADSRGERRLLRELVPNHLIQNMGDPPQSYGYSKEAQAEREKGYGVLEQDGAQFQQQHVGAQQHGEGSAAPHPDPGTVPVRVTGKAHPLMPESPANRPADGLVTRNHAGKHPSGRG